MVARKTHYKTRAKYSTALDAKQDIGKIKDDEVIFGITSGNLSVIDIMEHCISEIGGNANVMIATWTVGGRDITRIMELIQNKSIRDIRFILDRSFQTRHPDYCDSLRDSLGKEVIHFQKIHAKIFVVTTETEGIVCFSSMNMNENKRFECYTLTKDRKVCEKVEEFFNICYSKSPINPKNDLKFDEVCSKSDANKDLFSFDFDFDFKF